MKNQNKSAQDQSAKERINHMTKSKSHSPFYSALEGLDKTVFVMLGFDMKSREQVEEDDQ